MQQIPIEALPNQSFSIRLDDSFYQITIKETAGVMVMDIVRDSVTVIIGTRLTAGAPVIPYQYMEQGNFVFSNIGDEVIYYDKFGISQLLFYLSPSDLLEARA